MQLKLVGAQRYVDVRISEEVLEKGAVVDVSDDVAESLLQEVTYDSLNNANPLFVECEHTARRAPNPPESDDDGEEEPEAVVDTPTTEPRPRRTPAKSKKA